MSLSRRRGQIPQWASDLATQIDQTWRGGPQTAVWEEELAELDEGRATTAYVRLRRSERSAPTIALFYEVYRSLRLDDASTRDHCPVCDGSGFVDGPPIAVDGHSYSTQTWCEHCPTGRARRRTLAAVNAANHGPTQGAEL